MRRRRHALAASALAVGVLAVQAGLASPAHAATIRYASPAGTSAQSCLSAAAACNIEKAVTGAVAGDEVVIAPGTYQPTASLASAAASLKVHGTAGQPRPAIISAQDAAVSLTGDNVQVSDITIYHSGATFGLQAFGANVTVQRVEVHSTGPVACGFGYSGLARDSLCVTTAAGGVALDDSWGGGGSGTFTLVVRNVTAIATGTGSFGIRGDAGDSSNLVISARNVIASGSVDVRSTETATSSESTIVLSSSDYDTTQASGGGFVTTAGTGTNQKTPPVFMDLNTYHQAQSSPTVDKGTTDSAVGTTDIDGGPRKYGVAVDIGADEWTPDITPPDTVLDKTPKHHRSGKRKVVFAFHASEPSVFVCKVDKKKPVACASPWKVKTKRIGKHKLTVVAIDAAGNVDPTPATYKWKHIRHKKRKHHHGHHHARVVGTAGG